MIRLRQVWGIFWLLLLVGLPGGATAAEQDSAGAVAEEKREPPDLSAEERQIVEDLELLEILELLEELELVRTVMEDAS